MSNKTTFTALLTGLVCGVLVGFMGATGIRSKSGDTVTVRDTTTVTDTVFHVMPTAKDSVQVKYITRYLPVVKRDTLKPHRVDTIFKEFHAQNNGESIPPSSLSGDSDSAAVVIPITQKRYEGDDYRAYVSGYEPSLDSIFVFPKTTTIRERTYKPPSKWHIGITGGYGYGFRSKQAEPYVGIGITYSITSF